MKHFNETHGLTKTVLYSRYRGILNRCYNKKVKAYKNYGGRGINMCDEWKNDFIAFYNWANENGFKENLEIDRKNVNGNYCPKNCRFVTKKINLNNRTVSVIIEYNNITKTMGEWSEIYGLKFQTLWARINIYKYDIETALTKPIRKWNSKNKI